MKCGGTWLTITTSGQGNQNRAIQHVVEETKEHIKIKDTEARLAYNGI